MIFKSKLREEVEYLEGEVRDLKKKLYELEMIFGGLMLDLGYKWIPPEKGKWRK